MLCGNVFSPDNGTQIPSDGIYQCRLGRGKHIYGVFDRRVLFQGADISFRDIFYFLYPRRYRRTELFAKREINPLIYTVFTKKVYCTIL